MKKVIGIFTKHPREVGMSYYQHWKFALKLAFRFTKVAVCSVVHAFLPFLFTTYASTTVHDLHLLLNDRKHSGQALNNKAIPPERPGRIVRTTLSQANAIEKR